MAEAEVAEPIGGGPFLEKAERDPLAIAAPAEADIVAEKEEEAPAASKKKASGKKK